LQKLESQLDLDLSQTLVGAKFVSKIKKDKKSKKAKDTHSDSEQMDSSSMLIISGESPADSDLSILSSKVTTPGTPTNNSNTPQIVEVSRKSFIDFLPRSNQKNLSYDELCTRLSDLSNEETAQLAKVLLKEFAKEDTLLKVMSILIQEDPKQFIRQACDISDFKLAKFGGLSKMGKLIEDYDK